MKGINASKQRPFCVIGFGRMHAMSLSNLDPNEVVEDRRGLSWYAAFLPGNFKERKANGTREKRHDTESKCLCSIKMHKDIPAMIQRLA